MPYLNEETWDLIRKEYISGSSMAHLEKIFHVRRSAIHKRKQKEKENGGINWDGERTEYQKCIDNSIKEKTKLSVKEQTLKQKKQIEIYQQKEKKSDGEQSENKHGEHRQEKTLEQLEQQVEYLSSAGANINIKAYNSLKNLIQHCERFSKSKSLSVNEINVLTRAIEGIIKGNNEISGIGKNGEAETVIKVDIIESSNK